MISITIAIFGDNNTGKTSLINNFRDKKLLSNYETIGIENTSKIYRTKIQIFNCLWNNVEFLLNFKDVSERHFNFNKISNQIKKEPTICLLMFDFGNRQSYYNMKKKLVILKKKFGNSYFVLVGNKNDCLNKQITYHEAFQFAEKNNLLFYQINNNNKNIYILNTVLTQLYLDSFKKNIPEFKIIKKNNNCFFKFWNCF